MCMCNKMSVPFLLLSGVKKNLIALARVSRTLHVLVAWYFHLFILEINGEWDVFIVQ